MKISFIYTSPIPDRWRALDVLRGVALFFMILGNFLAYYKTLPSWFWHASWNGLTIADLGVPIFLFALGISYQLSWHKRIRYNTKLSAVLHFLKRYFILFAFGFLGYFVAMGKFQWEVLQLIGAVGILALGFMFMKPFLRIIIALLLLIVYQITILNGAHNWVMNFIETGLAGPYAILAWNFVLITGSVLAYLLKSKQKKDPFGILAIWALIYLFVGALLSLLIPFNKHLVSISYIIFSTGVAIVGLFLFHIITEIGHHRIFIFETLGKNALVGYITSQLLSVIIYKVLPNFQNGALLIFISFIILFICILLASFLDTRKVYFWL
ncbi:MAG: heparan-alpha-glucosaminide N-acetyltransferase domain-containing protein [candidate division WOR-3 bacterium]|nr:heparan-alpha-glucosaminide N-acetyltransferase domain-containing protein [candidate division WOR-3 bacterium]